MEGSLKEVWRRTMSCCVVSLVVLQVLGDIVVAKGEFLHKNYTDTSEESTATLIRDATEEISEGGEVRCHCNLPECVTVGYMCKSALGACFTRPTPTPAPSHPTYRRAPYRIPVHGCLELLPEERHTECAMKAGVHGKKSASMSQNAALIAASESDSPSPAIDPTQGPSPSTLVPHDLGLTCCSQDMCNFRDLDVFIRVDDTYSQRGEPSRGESEMLETVWFRAATIAVPIAGIFILVVLVLMASRMLAKENKRQRMAQVISERYLKAPLYPGGCTEPLQQHSLYYHPPLIKNTPLGHINLRPPYDEKPPNYRSPGTHMCNLEEIKPLNAIMSQDSGLWDQRDTDSPLPS